MIWVFGGRLLFRCRHRDIGAFHLRTSFTLSGVSQTDIIIKKSKFITISSRIYRQEDVSQFLDLYRQPKATHNCYAYKLSEFERVDDDCEVGGTAGLPILNAIKSQGFDNIIVLVIRYYGGIKLGKGGLYRAYGGCARDHLQASVESGHRVVHIPTLIVRYVVDTTTLGIFYHAMSKHQLFQISTSDDEVDGCTVLVYSIPTSRYSDVEATLSQNRSLSVKWAIIDD